MNLIEQAIEGHWGERCDDYEEGCPVCDAWREYDNLVMDNKIAQRAFTDIPARDTGRVRMRVDDTVTYAVQVNGKLRGQIDVAAAADEAVVRSAAEAAEKVAPHLAGKTVRKFVFVKGRLVNFVVG